MESSEASGLEPTSPSKEIEQQPLLDAIIVLGSGVVEKHHTWKDDSGQEQTSSRFEPGFDAKMRTIAAVEAYHQGLTKNLVFTGAVTTKGMPAEATSMHDYIRSRFQDEEGKFQAIPDDVIFEELESKDTSKNLINLKKLIEEHGWERIAILTNDYHIERAEKLAHNLDLDVEEMLSAEDKLEERDPRFRKVTDAYYATEGMAEREKLERKLRMLLVVDRQGRIPRFITEHTRG